ncbi:hypothetical protein ACVWZ6_004559 [Bradyrhizobium sp. GM6.1]
MALPPKRFDANDFRFAFKSSFRWSAASQTKKSDKRSGLELTQARDMISSMPPWVISAGPESMADPSAAVFSSHRASLASSACLEALLSAHAPLGGDRAAWSSAKGYRRLQSRSVKRSSSSSLKIRRAPLAIIESACGNSSQTGADASATPALISLFPRGFALPPSHLFPKPMQLNKQANELPRRLTQNSRAAANPTTHYNTPKQALAGLATGSFSL